PEPAFHHPDGAGRHRLPLPGRSTQSRRLAQLAAEPAGRPAAAGAFRLHRPVAGRTGRAHPDRTTERTGPLPLVGHMSARYPGYDVQSKRNGPSWNEPTRQVIDARLAVPREPRFFDAGEWRTLQALCARIVPQPANRPPVPLAALIDGKAAAGRGD